MPSAASGAAPLNVVSGCPQSGSITKPPGLAGPHENTDWPGKFPAIPWAYAEIVRHLARVERVYLLVQNRAAESLARDVLKKSGVNLGAIDFFRVPTDRGWMRDSGPICVRSHSGEVAYTHWLFNGWAKYSNYKKDAVAVTNVNKKLKTNNLAAPPQWPPRRSGRRQHRRQRPRLPANPLKNACSASASSAITDSPAKTTRMSSAAISVSLKFSG